MLFENNKINDKFDTKGCDDCIQDIAACAAYANDKSPANTVEYRPPRAEDPYRADGSCQRETNYESFKKGIERHGRNELTPM